MRGYLFPVVCVLACSLAGCQKRSAPAGPPAATQVADSVTLTEAQFAYAIPEGWTISELPGFKYKMAFGEAKDGFAATLNVVDEASRLDLDAYADATTQSMVKALKTSPFEVEDFKTAAGLPGKRYETDHTATGRSLHAIGYVFGSGDVKYILTGTCLPEDVERLRPLFDESARSFKFTERR